MSHEELAQEASISDLVSLHYLYFSGPRIGGEKLSGRVRRALTAASHAAQLGEPTTTMTSPLGNIELAELGDDVTCFTSEAQHGDGRSWTSRVFFESVSASEESSFGKGLVGKLLNAGNEKRMEDGCTHTVIINSYDPRIVDVAAHAGPGVKVSLLYEMSHTAGSLVNDTGRTPLDVFSAAGVEIRRERINGEEKWTLHPSDGTTDDGSTSTTAAAKIIVLPDPTTKRAYISDLLVYDGWKRRGLGGALVRYVLALEEFGGWRWGWTVFAENEPAVGLYLGLGAEKRGDLWVVEA